ncbi:hypothetical protein AVEN_69685-1 [Araneus ventricosus]|uniref:Uncharacterized protein n=1 Tax=Araneus ventricosus TaxID=182803 RepID=A0A4Y2TKG1_ARAVE|nr:hypothetical protein AVEN_69685-1 [Araneus ventricosus]
MMKLSHLFLPQRENRNIVPCLKTQSNKAHNGNAPDTLLLSFILNTSANEVHFVSQKIVKFIIVAKVAFSECIKENQVPLELLLSKIKGGSNISSLVHAAANEES